MAGAGRAWLGASAVALALCVAGLLALRLGDSSQHCLMTYMFEYPQFVRVTVPDNELYPQYGLFSYSEGRLTEKARKMRFDGIPILFLPGNSGSHQQARSIASVALRKAFSYEYDYHFDFYTVSYNEELSGLYGGVLERQTKFAALCLERILGLYKLNKHMQSVPTSVVVIGHSMGGVIAKRLLTYPQTANITHIAVTLAAPIAAPVINMDVAMNNYYLTMNSEWRNNSLGDRDRKVLISFGSGPRDAMVPASLTTSEQSDFSALITSIPGVWTSTDHLSIVWCKQFVLKFNKFLFAIVEKRTNQIVEDKTIIMAKARRYFKANRSMTLNPDSPRVTVPMVPDAFWYEDNRRMYQISRPEINKMTYLMIRLMGSPQDRFVAIEAANLEDRDWVYGCSALHTYGSHRICKNGTSLFELTRWSGAASDFSRRKLAFIHLHDLMMQEPLWTHVIVKIAPTKKPVVLNVDINDYASRNITVDVPSFFSFDRTVIKQETDSGAIYYELTLLDLTSLHHTYFLYVEPTATCKATQYHVSAEMHVPWAENNEYYHYFTHTKKKPMKLRLFNSNPNVTNSSDITQHVKITILLDPQCTFTISISPSRYHMLAQLARHYTPVLVPFVAAILLLATRSSLINIKTSGSALSIHSALASEGVKPYYALVCSRLGTTALFTVPLLLYALETASFHNKELIYFTRSLLCIPAYLTALGLVNVATAAILAVMVFSSQLAHRIILRIMWRGGGGTIAEKVASLLQRAPALVSAVLVCSAPASCGAASLAAGAAFYFFMLTKMYEEYLEDYSYKLLAKVMTRVRQYFKRNKKLDESSSEVALINPEQVHAQNDKEQKCPESSKAIEDSKEGAKENKLVSTIKEKENVDVDIIGDSSKVLVFKQEEITNVNNLEAASELGNASELTNAVKSEVKETPDYKTKDDDICNDIDEELSGLNFHMTMFLLWLIVTLVNLPALLTWARNYKYSMVLVPDTSFYPGMVMSLSAGFLWQMNAPRTNLKHYKLLSDILFVLAVIIIVLGTMAAYYISYVVTAAFTLITMQQLFDKEVPSVISERGNENTEAAAPNTDKRETSPNEDAPSEENILENLKEMKEKFDFAETDVL